MNRLHDTRSIRNVLQILGLSFGNATAILRGMKRSIQILVTVGAMVAPVLAQNYPPPPPQYPQQQPAQYPQQQYPQQQPPPYYGQDQQYPQQPPAYPPQQLDQLVGRIALYPDPLLAQILTASTFSNQIMDAAGWARAHSYLSGEQLSQAIQQDQLPGTPASSACSPSPQF